MTTRDDKKEVMQIDAGQLPEPRPVAPPGLSSDGPGVSKVALPEPVAKRSTTVDGTILCEPVYTAAQLESYAAARVAEATAELQRRVAELEANDRRYRWLRDSDGDAAWRLLRFSMPAGVSIDAAIDAILADREGGKA